MDEVLDADFNVATLKQVLNKWRKIYKKKNVHPTDLIKPLELVSVQKPV